MLIPDPKIVRSPRELRAGETAQHIKKALESKEYKVRLQKYASIL
jgi:hypothetical protein